MSKQFHAMSTDATSSKELSRSDNGTAVCDPEPAQDGGVDPERVLHKLDWRLLPLLCLLFILSFLYVFLHTSTTILCSHQEWFQNRDRINIGNRSCYHNHRDPTKLIRVLFISTGNAKVAGLVTDLHLTGLQYNICAALFFVESPSPHCFADELMRISSRFRTVFSKFLRASIRLNQLKQYLSACRVET